MPFHRHRADRPWGSALLVVYRLLNPLSFVAFKKGRLRGGPSRPGAKGASLNRYVTDQQRSSRPIFNATLRAAASWLFFCVARSTVMIHSTRSRLLMAKDIALVLSDRAGSPSSQGLMRDRTRFWALASAQPTVTETALRSSVIATPAGQFIGSFERAQAVMSNRRLSVSASRFSGR